MVNEGLKKAEGSIKIFLELSIFIVTFISIFMTLLGLPVLYTINPANTVTTTNSISHQYQQTFQNFHFTYDLFITLMLILLSFYSFLMSTVSKDDHKKFFWLNITLISAGTNIGTNLYFIGYTVLTIYQTYLGGIFVACAIFYIFNYEYAKNINSLIKESSDLNIYGDFWYKLFEAPNAIFILSLLASVIIALISLTSTNCSLVTFLHC